MNLTKAHKVYFQAAKDIAELSDFDKVHIGCVVVQGHRIISSGFNTKKTHPIQKTLNKERFHDDTNHSIHAEVSALIPLLNKEVDWKSCSLYIYRTLKNGQRALARPCPSCQRLIRQLGIKKIYYTGNDSYVSEIFE